ncbi:MAG TPA: aspartate kinase, partial [Gemmataceae bacterium]|nr:aspartate kinase [Gemmataceae bacterium]
MSLVVQKFGGSSVATAERIMAAARRAIRAKQAGHQVIVVVSARGDTTDDLISLAREITDHPPAREMDMLLATGEQISIALTAMAIQALGEPAISFTGAQIGIVTDSFHTKARIKNISTQRMRQALDEGKIVIVAGFQGIDENYNITTLGRGGSDTTAVALAAVMKHDAAAGNGEVGCEIYTDVDGVYTTDPRLVPEARKMDAISYDEMLELASVGAGVMHSRSIEFAKKYDVPLQVRSSFSDVEGTWIVPEADWMHDVAVCGCAIVRDEARVTIRGVPDQPGVSHRIFSAIAGENVVVDMIAQNVGSAGRAAIGFTVLANELPATLAVLRPLAAEWGASVEHQDGVSKVSVVGTGMRTHTGVAERMFGALAAAGVKMKMITTGDIKISVLVDRADGAKALRAVHQAFGLHEPRPGAGLPARPGKTP